MLWEHYVNLIIEYGLRKIKKKLKLLNLLSFGAIFSSILVITAKNPVVAVIFLITLFINTAGYLIILGISFVGISYIIIYIGAITVLFLFVIMMVNIRLLDILEIGREYTKNIPLAFLVGTFFIYEIYFIIPFSLNDIDVLNLPIDFINYVNSLNTNSNISSSAGSFYSSGAVSAHTDFSFYSLSSLSPEMLTKEYTQISVLGQGLYTYGAIWLLLSSIILLLSMVSAIFLSSSKNLNYSEEISITT